MRRNYFEQYRDAVRHAYSQGLQCDVEAFDREELTIVDRPENTPWYMALALTFGTGTVLCIDPAYRAFAEAHRPPKHYQASSASFLGRIGARGAGTGRHAGRLVAEPVLHDRGRAADALAARRFRTARA